MSLAWNVYTGDWSSGKIVEYNIFNHYGFLHDIAKAAKKSETVEEFELLLRRAVRYYFWAKCEYEVIVSHWPPRQDNACRKIDVSEQISMNWEHFLSYVWTHKKELLKEAKDRK